MAVSKRSDPFRPPGDEERSLELAREPQPAAMTGEVAAPLVEPPTARAPVRYRRPTVSWLTLVVLGFAAIGLVAVSGLVVRKLAGLAPGTRRETPAPAAAPVLYRPLDTGNAVLVEVRVTPSDARIMLDGEPITSNPLRLPRGPTLHKLAVTAPGFAPVVQELTADAPRTIRLRLVRAR